MRLTQIHRFPERLLSTVHRGTAFEYRALALLTQHLSMSLTRVGGSHDGGVDLIGWWWVPCEKPITTYPLHPTAEPRSWDTVNRRRLRVLAQCKAEKRKMGPAYLRELEGVVYRYANTLDSSSPHVSRDPASSCPPQSTPTPTSATMTASDPPSPPVALLVSESAFTRNCLHAAHASPLPFLLVHLPPSTSSTGAADADAPGTVFGNPALVSARGVLGGEIEIRWERAGAPSSEALGNGRPGLWWQGRPLPSWTPDCRL